jgi:diguanylate cyclase (GGDEF)-like protein/PAS domain S-box-containing protein
MRGGQFGAEFRESRMRVDDGFWKTILDNLYDGVCFVDREKRISYWNRGAERITGFSSTDMVGAKCWEHVATYLDAAESPKLGNIDLEDTALIPDGLYREEEVFLHHKEGHRIRTMTRIAPIRDLQGNVVGGVVLFSDNRAMSEARLRIDELELMALLDPVTRLGNKRYAELQIQRGLDGLIRYGWHFGLLFIDVDNCRRINEQFGRARGDQALRTVAKTMSGSVRSSDVLSRWGGDEFICLLVNIRRRHLLGVARKLCRLVEKSTLNIGQDQLGLTVSIGATVAQEEDTVAMLVSRAEGLAHRGKAAGGNQVILDPKLVELMQ